MARDFLGEAEREATQSASFRRWVAQRIAAIHDRVSAGDVLARNGVHLKYGGHRPEQLSCPFHGTDNRPSARYFPDGESPAHIWCYVCKERWDSITLWRKFNQFEGPFTRLLFDIERAFGIDTPEAPTQDEGFEDDGPDAEVLQLMEICERRLRGARASFDLRAFLTVGSILDRLSYRLETQKITVKAAMLTLHRVLDKIGEKERACPGGSN
jgi:hypothetical protein